jgi:hypothetical protein
VSQSIPDLTDTLSPADAVLVRATNITASGQNLNLMIPDAPRLHRSIHIIPGSAHEPSLLTTT